MDFWRCGLWALALAGCGGGSSVVAGDDDDDTTDPAPVGDDDDDDATIPPGGELVRVDYPEGIDFTWESGASECPFVVGTLTITNDHESVDAPFELTADQIGGQPALMFRPEGVASSVPELRLRATPGQTMTLEVLYACMVTMTFDTDLHFGWELPTIEGPFSVTIPVHGEIAAP